MTHPSESKHITSASGDFLGLALDDWEAIPTNISTIIDPLDEKNVGRAEYQGKMPTDNYLAYNFTNPDDTRTTPAGTTL